MLKEKNPNYITITNAIVLYEISTPDRANNLSTILLKRNFNTNQEEQGILRQNDSLVILDY